MGQSFEPRQVIIDSIRKEAVFNHLADVDFGHVASHHDLCIEVIGVLADRVFNDIDPAPSIIVIERDDHLRQLAIPIVKIFVCAANFLVNFARWWADRPTRAPWVISSRSPSASSGYVRDIL